MNPTLKNRLVGAAVLVAVGILIPVALILWAQAGGGLADGNVRVYKINEQGEVVPLAESASRDHQRSDAGESSVTGQASTDSAPDSTGQAPANSQAQEPEGATQPENSTGNGANSKPVIPARPEWDVESQPEPGTTERAPEPAPAPESAPEPAPEPAPAPEPPPADARPEEGWVVQIGSFSKAKNAHDLESQVADEYPVFITVGTVSGTQYHRVRVGPFASEQAAEQAAHRLSEAGYATQVQYTE